MMAKEPKPKPGPRDGKGRGPTEKVLERAQNGKMDPIRELQAIIAAKQGMDPTLAGPPQRMSTMNNQLQTMHNPAVRQSEMRATMQPDAIEAILQMVLGGGAGGGLPAPPGQPQLRDMDADDPGDHEYR